MKRLCKHQEKSIVDKGKLSSTEDLQWGEFVLLTKEIKDKYSSSCKDIGFMSATPALIF